MPGIKVLSCLTSKGQQQCFFLGLKTCSRRKNLLMPTQDFKAVHIIWTLLCCLQLSILKWQVALCVLIHPYSFSIYLPREYGLGRAAGCHCDLLFTQLRS